MSDNIYKNLLSGLDEIYSIFAKSDYNEELNMFVLNAYSEIIKDIKINDIRNFVKNNSFIKEIIINNYNKDLIYRQPIIVFLCYLISRKKHKTLELWPLTKDEISFLYTNLGISLQD